jgi:3'(2'), 5'-bisphosphate nucleotidase
VWIIDPVDGTREYSEGRTDWAVHIALWEEGELALGVVGIPDEGLVLSSVGVRVPRRSPGPLRIAVSRTRPPALVDVLVHALKAEQVAMGSAGVKIAAVVRGQVDAYVHAGGQYEWDSAAPVAVARAAGLHTSRLDGSALVYNRTDPYLPDLLVCRAEVRATMLDALGALPAEVVT